ncbi:MAG: hypothetical protein AAGJ50_08790, partial [Pseudomonadota bacterium]
MWRILFRCGVLIALGVGSLSTASPQNLPNQRAVLVNNFDGSSSLEGWSTRPSSTELMYDRYAPDNPAFRGAETWKIPVEDSDLRRGTLTAFAAAGMQKPEIIAFEYGNPSAMDVLDSHPDANMASIMVRGQIN